MKAYDTFHNTKSNQIYPINSKNFTSSTEAILLNLSILICLNHNNNYATLLTYHLYYEPKTPRPEF